MASTVIKGGTVVTADLTYAADVLVEDGVITAIGPNLKGDTTLEASCCYLTPGGIAPPGVVTSRTAAIAASVAWRCQMSSSAEIDEFPIRCPRALIAAPTRA